MDDPMPLFHLPQKYPPCVTAEVTASEIHAHFAALQGLKSKYFLLTLCHCPGCCLWLINCLLTNYLTYITTPDNLFL
jgi:hypothetical protein